MPTRKKQFITNARDIRKFTRKKKIVTNPGNAIDIRPGKPGPNELRVPCPPGEFPCGYSWSGDQPGHGDRSVNCCPYAKPHGNRAR